jgi:hypothetical protein
MEITKDIEIIGKALWFKKEKILVISDLHIGYEFMLREKGVGFPLNLYKTMKEDMKKILKRVVKKYEKIKKIIILGDLKHEFGRINQEEWRNVLDFIDFLKKKNKESEIILIKGNHDVILGPLVKNKNVKIVDFLVIEDFCFFHGDKIFKECLDKKVKFWILGHKHPAINISEGYKSELFKCFLFGEYVQKKLIILPSFFPLIEGSDVFMYDTHFAFKLNESEFRVYVLGQDTESRTEIYNFGKVKDIKNNF